MLLLSCVPYISCADTFILFYFIPGLRVFSSRSFFFFVLFVSVGRSFVVSRKSFLPCVSAPPCAFALSTHLDQVDVVDSAFEGNYVSDVASWSSYNYFAGGGLAVYGEAEIALRTASFVGNGAEVGGGVSVRGNCTVTVDGSLFDGNLAFSRGGGFSGGVSVCVCCFLETV